MIYPFRGLHNRANDNVDSAMVNIYDILRSTFAAFATLRIFMKRSMAHILG